MSKVLLTGGSGFIAAHILEQLLAKGHTVVTTVRSEDKASKIRAAHASSVQQNRLTVAIVPDLAQPGAFDEVVAQSADNLQYVLHTASPFHFRWTDAQTELIDPAVIGTTGILKAIKRSAPSVKRVVVTSSFAAIVNENRFSDPTLTVTEKSWNPDTLEAAGRSQLTAYRISKTLAERAAWDFVAEEKPNFDLVTVNPPLVIGPVVHYLASVDAINTSNERLVSVLRGSWKTAIPAQGPIAQWVDVRDLAKVHILAIERPGAGGRRLFTVTGRLSNREFVRILRDNLPEYKDKLPGPEIEGGDLPPVDKIFKHNNDETNKFLGIKWIDAEKSITDTVLSIKDFNI